MRRETARFWPGVVAASIGLIAGCSEQSAATSARQANAYRDDTFALPPAAERVTLAGEQLPKPYYLPHKKRAGPLYLDLRGARFFLNNSKNKDPNPALRCDQGSLPVNSYPLNIFSAAQVSIVGGVINGSVPQQSDWNSSYCNSAAVNFKNSPNGAVDGIRIARAWDGVRIGPNSDNFRLTNAWLSNIRDDAIENDHLFSGHIEDSLIDGTLQGISLRPNAKSTIGASTGIVVIEGSLIRLHEYPYKGRPSSGSLAKADARSPRLRIANSVVAIDSPNDRRWAGSWAVMAPKMEASNNLLLWLSDSEMPPGLPVSDAGFRLLKGAEARSAWAAAKRNWVNCHPKVGRVAGDPKSDFQKCVSQTWGGFSD